jgi:hypothetical protein
MPPTNNSEPQPFKNSCRYGIKNYCINVPLNGNTFVPNHSLFHSLTLTHISFFESNIKKRNLTPWSRANFKKFTVIHSKNFLPFMELKVRYSVH